MATTPPLSPDTIEPDAPMENPTPSRPMEEPGQMPDEIEPVQPDYDQPDTAPMETPPPPD